MAPNTSSIAVTVPMPSSLRDKKKTPEHIKNIIHKCCRGRKLPSIEYDVTMTFYSNWRLKNGKIRKKDVLNYAATLSDIIADALNIDDSMFWNMKLLKVTSSKNQVHISIVPTTQPK